MRGRNRKTKTSTALWKNLAGSSADRFFCCRLPFEPLEVRRLMSVSISSILSSFILGAQDDYEQGGNGPEVTYFNTQIVSTDATYNGVSNLVDARTTLYPAPSGDTSDASDAYFQLDSNGLGEYVSTAIQ